ncbi:MAG: ABC transporter permease [Alphaproteobacteria bacterium]
MTATLTRIGAMVLRHLYLLIGSWTRVVELAYWPTMQMVLWGLISQFFVTNPALASSPLLRAAGVLVGAVLLWDVMFRGHLGVSIGFLEELWSRNLGQLFASPLRPWEWVVSLVCLSFLRTLIGVIPATLLAIPLYHYSIYDMGLPLIAFFTNLIVMGWAIGLAVCSLIMRYGLSAESLAWAIVFAIAPLSCIYYPLATLPDWAQPLAQLFPATHVFEGMRAVMNDGVFRLDLLGRAVAFNIIYLGLGSAAFLHAFRRARVRGALMKTGE